MLHWAIFRAICIATKLRDKLHETLPSVTAPLSRKAIREFQLAKARATLIGVRARGLGGGVTALGRKLKKKQTPTKRNETAIQNVSLNANMPTTERRRKVCGLIRCHQLVIPLVNERC